MLLELVILYLLVRGAAEAWKETKAAWGKSRKAYTSSAGRRYPGASPRRRVAQAARHDLGYGLSQLLHGFPTARHGFAQGWNEGRQAHVQARTAREQARTEHAETHAGALAQWRDLRERRKEAQEEIRRSRAGETPEGSDCLHAPDPCEIPNTCGCRCDGCAAAYSAWVASRAAVYGDNDEDTTLYGDPGFNWDAPLPGEEAPPPPSAQEGTPSMPDITVCGHCHARSDEEHRPECPVRGLPGWPRRSPAPGRAGQEAPAGTGTTEGTASMSDVTYDGVARRMTSAIAAAEARGQEIAASTAYAEDQHNEAGAAKRWASVTADEMQGLNMDPATLGAMADHLDAADEAEKAYAAVLEALARAAKAQARVLETAQAVDAALKRGHSGIKQAHDDAPVEAAERGFYQD